MKNFDYFATTMKTKKFADMTMRQFIAMTREELYAELDTMSMQTRRELRAKLHIADEAIACSIEAEAACQRAKKSSEAAFYERGN